MELSEIVAQLNNADLVVTQSDLVLEKFTRCKVSDDKGGKQSGWYFIYEYRARNGKYYYGGQYGNWKIHDREGLKLQGDFSGLSQTELAEIKKKQDAARKKQANEKKQRHQEAAQRAKEIWENLPDGGRSGYLDKKQVKGYGVRFSRGSIVVPVRKADHSLTGLQFINSDSTKKFLTGTEKQGCFHVIGEALSTGVRIVCEGYATAASIFEASKHPTYIAFDAGNLVAVAKILRKQYPDDLIVIAGDDDSQGSENKGRIKAEEAAKAVNGLAVFPEFQEVA